MAKKYSRSQYKKERNANKDTRPKATLRNARVSTTKAAFVLDAIRGKSVEEALAILKFLPNKAAAEAYKVVKSAAANATNNHQLNAENLYIKECYANEGVVLKRFMPRAKGSASSIFKRTSHITVVVSDER